MLVNEAPHSVNGHIFTEKYPKPDGTYGRHKSNFRLQAKGTMHDEGYPLDKAEFCSYGPFFEGRMLEITLKTLFPVFSCKSKIDQGPIMIHSEPREDDPFGGVRMWADCYE